MCVVVLIREKNVNISLQHLIWICVAFVSLCIKVYIYKVLHLMCTMTLQVNYFYVILSLISYDSENLVETVAFERQCMTVFI